MSLTPVTAQMKSRLTKARQLVDSAQVVQAESAYSNILREWPECLEACLQLARFAMDRTDPVRAANFLERACTLAPTEPQIAVNLGFAYAYSGRPAGARKLMEQVISKFPDFAPAWLLLGQIHDMVGDRISANQAISQAIRRAQRNGQWLDESTTPPGLVRTVKDGVERIRGWRREHLNAALELLRQQHGNDELKRVDRALRIYLREIELIPTDARQRPRFLYIPDIPSIPFLDPGLMPWTRKLTDSYPAIRAEAARLLAERAAPEMTVSADAAAGGGATSWDNDYFYRHGQRNDALHARCPATSTAIDSLDLCRIRDQAPGACFAWMKPNSHLSPRHGLTNTRVVLQLPLIVPGDCAVSIIDGETAAWCEGELKIHDDTFQHEAWNRTSQMGVILMLDAWNPYLTEIERIAVTQLVEAISDFEGALNPS